jgi:5-methyltetrahydropteroyltriglutamate--homocysteine methyltransferase
VPSNKVVVLGLMTTKVPAIEPVTDLARRITDASRFVPLERLCVSPQCGFSSTVHGNEITEADQWAKLERLLELTRQVWK